MDDPVRGQRTLRSWRGPHGLFDTVGGIALALGILATFLIVVAGTRPLDGPYMIDVFGVLAAAVRVSLVITVVSFVAGLPVGLLVGWARTLRSQPLALGNLAGFPKRLAHRLADGYVEVMRGTPLFLQIIFSWSLFLVSFPTVDNLALAAGTLAMTANTGAYQGEIFRAGFQTVQAGQLEAARAIGLTRWRAMRHVVLPQALRLITPPLTNEFIGLFKFSSLLFFIGVQELTFVYYQLARFEARIFELFALVTFLYLAITIPVSKAVGYFERRYRIPGLGIQAVREPLIFRARRYSTLG